MRSYGPSDFRGLNIGVPLADLLELLAFVNGHPSIRSVGAESSFNTTSSARNSKWQPFIVGLIGPDNPVNFVPISKVKREIPMAETPPSVPKPKVKNVKVANNKPGDAPSSSVVPRASKMFQMEDLRQALHEAWSKANGGQPPTDTQLAFMLSQAAIESGGFTGGRFSGTTDEVTFRESKSAPNFNFSSHEIGMANNTVTGIYDSATNAFVYTDDKGKPLEPPKTVSWSADRMVMGSGGVAYYAPPESNPGYYQILNNSTSKYVGLDSNTTGGKKGLRLFQSFNSLQEAADTYASYVLSHFPDVRTAETPEAWNHAIQYGLPIEGPAKHYSFHGRDDATNEGYVDGLRDGLAAYKKKWGAGSGGTTTADQSASSDQHIMTFAARTDLDDPLGPAFGRTIGIDVARQQALALDLASLQASITALNSMPPLILLVNPQEFRRSHENTVDFGVKTRVGNIVHTWLEQPIKINSSGISAAQYAMYADNTGGLTNHNRIFSLSYRNLMSLVLMYKSNGMVYDLTGQQLGSIVLAGSVFIAFDDHVYIGSFDSFTLTDSADKPHNMSYSFTFTVRHDIHVDVLTYG